MAKRKSSKRRSSRRYKAKRRRILKTVPIEMLMGAAGTLFIPGKEGYFSPMDHIKSGNWDGVMKNYLAGFTGIDADKPTLVFDPMKALNPFDFSTARYWKILLYTGIIGMVRKKIVKQSSILFKKIPFIGRWVS